MVVRVLPLDVMLDKKFNTQSTTKVISGQSGCHVVC